MGFELCIPVECVFGSSHPRGAEDPLEKEKVRHVSPILLGWSSEKLEHVALLKRMDHIRRAGKWQVAHINSFAMSEITGGKNDFFMTHHALNEIQIFKPFYQII